MEPISICIITKNESKVLKKCLNILYPISNQFGHEIVVVDTGSEDDTLQMVTQYTTSVYQFKWINDFSAARNYAAKMAKNKWILVIDSDEMINKWNEKTLQSQINSHPNEIGLLDIIDTCGHIGAQYQSKTELARLYNKTLYHFVKTVHEQIVPLGHMNLVYFKTSLEILHASYSGTSEELKKKSLRNISLLKEEYAKSPHDPYVLFQLGQSYYMLEDYQEASHYYSLAIAEEVNPEENYVKTLVVSYGYSLIELGQLNKALELEGVYDIFCKRADFVFLIAMLYMKTGYFDMAIQEFEKATTLEDYEVIGSNSFRAWFNIGVIYECLGEIDKAILNYKKCGDFENAKKRLEVLK